MPKETAIATENRIPFTSQQGLRINATDADQLREALGAAVDYRGDIPIHQRDHGSVEGYIFDLRPHDDAGQFTVRLIPKDGGTRLAIRLCDIEAIEFSGRDTAAGKSFETWMKKYVEKKLAGQTANIESESLEED